MTNDSDQQENGVNHDLRKRKLPESSEDDKNLSVSEDDDEDDESHDEKPSIPSSSDMSSSKLNSSQMPNREDRLMKNRQKARDRRNRKKILVEDMQRNVVVLSRLNSDLRKKNQELLKQLADYGVGASTILGNQKGLFDGAASTIGKQPSSLGINIGSSANATAAPLQQLFVDNRTIPDPLLRAENVRPRFTALGQDNTSALSANLQNPGISDILSRLQTSSIQTSPGVNTVSTNGNTVHGGIDLRSLLNTSLDESAILRLIGQSKSNQQQKKELSGQNQNSAVSGTTPAAVSKSGLASLNSGATQPQIPQQQLIGGPSTQQTPSQQVQQGTLLSNNLAMQLQLHQLHPNLLAVLQENQRNGDEGGQIPGKNNFYKPR